MAVRLPNRAHRSATLVVAMACMLTGALVAGVACEQAPPSAKPSNRAKPAEHSGLSSDEQEPPRQRRYEAERAGDFDATRAHVHKCNIAFIRIVHDPDLIAVRSAITDLCPLDAEIVYGKTPLQAAAELGHLEIAKTLIDGGARLNQAISRDSDTDRLKEMVGVRCSTGILSDSNKPGEEAGMTALHLAAREGHLELVRLLLDRGADPNISSHHGLTSLDVARENYQTEVTSLLATRTESRPPDLPPSSDVRFLPSNTPI